MSRTAAVPLMALISRSQGVVGQDSAVPAVEWSRLRRFRAGGGGVEDFFEVADEGYVGADVFVDLGGVDFDVDLFALGE